MKRSPKSSGVWTPDSERTYTRKRIDRADSRNRGSLRAFAEWLRSSRGLQPGSVTVRMGSACTFVDAVAAQSGRSCAMAFRLLTCVEIEDFFVDYAKKQGKAGLRSMQAAMRLFLRFAASRGWVGLELVQAVPSQRSYRLSHLPRGVSDAHLLKLLESRWQSGQSGRRDSAIVYLLATYGIRRGQLSALKLTDIDWHAKTIRFAAHKGGKEIRHGLTDACAQVLAEYLRRERQPSESEFVFLRGRRPYVRLSPAAISQVVRAWTVRCGIAPYYPHAFRHAFASRLLRARQPAKTISDLLGHRSLDAVGIYAKVDHARLLEASVEWPEASS